jgi:hypothetical protein
MDVCRSEGIGLRILVLSILLERHRSVALRLQSPRLSALAGLLRLEKTYREEMP